MPLYKKRKSCHYKLWYNFIWQTFHLDFLLYKIVYFLYKLVAGNGLAALRLCETKNLRAEHLCGKSAKICEKISPAYPNNLQVLRKRSVPVVRLP